MEIDPRALSESIQRELVSRLDPLGRRLVEGIRKRSSDDTGELDASYTHQVNAEDAKLLIGTELLYGRFRELGTVKMRPEGAIRRTLAESTNTIRRTLGR
jgi:hypothetical protein